MRLEISNLSKQYRWDFWGLRGFSLEVGHASIVLLRHLRLTSWRLRAGTANS